MEFKKNQKQTWKMIFSFKKKEKTKHVQMYTLSTLKIREPYVSNLATWTVCILSSLPASRYPENPPTVAVSPIPIGNFHLSQTPV